MPSLKRVGEDYTLPTAQLGGFMRVSESVPAKAGAEEEEEEEEGGLKRLEAQVQQALGVGSEQLLQEREDLALATEHATEHAHAGLARARVGESGALDSVEFEDEVGCSGSGADAAGADHGEGGELWSEELD